VPETFRFTVLTADPAVKDSKGAVCMWIKVQDSQGQSNGTEGFDNFESHPIPQGHTASVVFSHDLLVHSVLKVSYKVLGHDSQLIVVSVSRHSSRARRAGWELSARPVVILRIRRMAPLMPIMVSAYGFCHGTMLMSCAAGVHLKAPSVIKNE
jgi:hypothetical protein